MVEALVTLACLAPTIGLSASLFVPPLHTRHTAPTSTFTIGHPDGRDIIIEIYRCLGCGGTHWGPKVDDSDTWWCLDCHRIETDYRQVHFIRIDMLYVLTWLNNVL